MFGSSFLLSMALKFLAEKGLAMLEQESAILKPEAEAALKAIIHPEVLEPVIWGAISSIWDMVMGAAKVLAVALEDGKDPASALAAAVASLKPHMEAALAAA